MPPASARHSRSVAATTAARRTRPLRQAARERALGARTAADRAAQCARARGRVDPAARARPTPRQEGRPRRSPAPAARRHLSALALIERRSAPRRRTRTAAPPRRPGTRRPARARSARGSASIPIGLEIAITARSRPSARTSSARRSGSLGFHVDHVRPARRRCAAPSDRPHGERAADACASPARQGTARSTGADGSRLSWFPHSTPSLCNRSRYGLNPRPHPDPGFRRSRRTKPSSLNIIPHLRSLITRGIA